MNWEKYGIDISRVRGGKGYCPKCHDTRKNKHDKSLSVDLSTGLFNCHNFPCDFKGCADESKRDSTRIKKDYTKPPERLQKVSDDILTWFQEERGISNDTLLRLKVTEAVEWMPQTQCELQCICFNYYRDNELINVKFRGPDKEFRLVSGAELIFYNLDSIKGESEAMIVEGECFTEKTQLLTENGWVNFNEYNGGKVAQVLPDRTIEFVEPNAIIKKHYDGKLVELSNNHGYRLTSTENHNLAYFKPKEKDRECHEILKAPIREISRHFGLPISGFHDGPGIPLSDMQLRLFIAISADFTFRDNGYILGALKKERKIERIKWIFDDLSIPYKIGKITSNGLTPFYISSIYCKEHLGFLHKDFPKEWYTQLSYNQKVLILSEILFWDGNSVPNRNQIEYSTNRRNNADFIQYLCHSTGIKSSIIKRHNQYGKWFKLSILLGKKHNNYQAINREFVDYSGMVYCVNVPSGFIMVRENDNISITGNCDVAAAVESGIYNCVSVPNGASSGNSKLEYLDNCWEAFEGMTKIILATDNDAPGIALRDELARRFGKHRCYKVEYPEGCKDTNDVLCKYGKDAVREMYNNARPWPLEGIKTLEDFYPEVQQLYDQGYPKGLRAGIPGFDDHASFNTMNGELWTVVGIPNHGKSEFMDLIMAKTAVNLDFKWGICAFETPYVMHTSLLMEKISGKAFGFRADKTKRMNQWEAEQAVAKIDSNFFFFDLDDDSNDLTPDGLIEKFRQLVVSRGVNAIVLDPWSYVEVALEKGQTETQFVQQSLIKIKKFCKAYGVHVFIVCHPVKTPKDEKTGKYHVPTLYSINGSSYWFSLTDNGLCVYRNFDSGITDVHIQKWKRSWLGNVDICSFLYDTQTRQYNKVNF